MNILISVNKKYLDKAATMLFSLKRNTKEPIAVYLLNHSLAQEEITRFEKYLKKESIAALHVVNVDSDFFDAFPLGSYFSVEAYFRILAQLLLPASLDRILWLDADIIIRKDLQAFYAQPFDGMKYVVCPDDMNPDKEHVRWTAKAIKELFGIPQEHLYFNSGVMLMNLELLRQETDKEKILQKCQELKDKLLYADQDILNTLYFGQVKYADMKIYNHQIYGIEKMPKGEAEQAAVLHYIGRKKPWNYHYMTNASKYYWKVRWTQGHRLETVKNYALAAGYMAYTFLRNVKNLFF